MFQDLKLIIITLNFMIYVKLNSIIFFRTVISTSYSSNTNKTHNSFKNSLNLLDSCEHGIFAFYCLVYELAPHY